MGTNSYGFVYKCLLCHKIITRKNEQEAEER